MATLARGERLAQRGVLRGPLDSLLGSQPSDEVQHPAISATIPAERARGLAFAATTSTIKFLLGGQEVNVQDGEARLASSGSLAGSTLTMDAAARRAVQECGLPIEVASAAASGNPARALGIDDQCGAIAADLAADLVVLDEQLRVVQVIADGVRCGAPDAATAAGMN